MEYRYVPRDVPMNRQEAVAWLAGLFEEPVGNVGEETARESIYGWDSLGTLTLMAEMDEKFDIQLSEKDVAAFLSIGDVVNLLAGRGKLT